MRLVGKNQIHPSPRGSLQRGRRSLGNTQGWGEQKKASAARSTAANTITDGNQAPAAAMPTTSSPNNKRKATTSELVKAAGYAEREAGKSKRRC